MKSDFVKELYYRELDAKRDLDARPTLHVAVLSVLGSLLAYSFIHFTGQNGLQESWFNLFLSTAAVSYGVAVANVILATQGHPYARLPLVESLQSHSANLAAFFRQTPGAEGSALTDFEDFIRRRMIEATSKNEYANLSRAARHYSAMRAMSLCLVFALMAVLPVLWNSRTAQASQSRSSQRESFFGGTMVDNEKPKPAAEPIKPSKPEAMLPAKPAEPENILFRGTQQPPKPRPQEGSAPPAPKLKK